MLKELLIRRKHRKAAPGAPELILAITDFAKMDLGVASALPLLTLTAYQQFEFAGYQQFDLTTYQQLELAQINRSNERE